MGSRRSRGSGAGSVVTSVKVGANGRLLRCNLPHQAQSWGGSFGGGVVGLGKASKEITDPSSFFYIIFISKLSGFGVGEGFFNYRLL